MNARLMQTVSPWLCLGVGLGLAASLAGGEPCNYQTHHSPQSAKSKDPMKDHIDRLKKETDAESMYNLGLHYASGEGLGGKPNLAQALKLFEAAAEKNYGPAQLSAAYCYKNGWGAKVNETKARLLFERAADNNVPEASFEAGLLVLNEDREKARIHFEKAATTIPEAQWQLAIYYSFGSSRSRNPTNETKWTFMAALNGHPVAIARTNDWEKHKITASKAELEARAAGFQLAVEEIEEIRSKVSNNK